jgi:hypothetical protein
MAKKVYVDCVLEWAKLNENNRDMGKHDGSDVANKLDEIQGQYVVNCVIDQSTKSEMVAKGIPNKGMQAQLFKETNDGRMYYKAKRPHFNPKLTDQQTGQPGVVMGAPKIYKQVDGSLVEWDWDEDGLIGNGTTATVKFDVWDGKIVTLEAIKILDHVKYEVQEAAF